MSFLQELFRGAITQWYKERFFRATQLSEILIQKLRDTSTKVNSGW